MIFREIKFGSADYRDECGLRQEILRAPLSLNLYHEDLGGESQQFHFGLFAPGGELLACVIAVPLLPAHAKVRQMAVRVDQQGKGCGRRLMQELEKELARRGISQVSLHARLSAVGFYAKLGYAKAGAEFTEVGIAHVQMKKLLAP